MYEKFKIMLKRKKKKKKKSILKTPKKIATLGIFLVENIKSQQQHQTTKLLTKLDAEPF